jgi:hypothetical protein
MTVHGVMQARIGMGLRSRCKPEQEIPHGLLVLLMQMKANNAETERAPEQE